MMHNLSQLRFFTDLWNKIKRDSSLPTLHISEDDLVIFVVGPTGSGKSWFIREATNSDLVKTSNNTHPLTREVQAIRCELTEEAKKDLKERAVNSIIFVDTPSFYTGHDDLDARKEFEKWLDRTKYKPRAELVGVIYIHRAETDPRAVEPIHEHLQELSTIPLFVDGRIPRRLHVVMSYDKLSSKVSPSKIKERRTKLCSQLNQLKDTKWKSSIHEEVFQGEPEVAWRAIQELFNN